MSSMAQAASPDGFTVAEAARIIKHMNSDHQSSLALYLEHYAAVSSFWAGRNPRLTDISFTSMTISCSIRGKSRSFSIPFDPPLASAAETRPRVVEMDTIARKKLGRAPEDVTRWLPPATTIELITFAGVLLGFVAFARTDSFQPHSWLTRSLLRWMPAETLAFLRSMQPMALAIMIGLHAFETLYMAWFRLRPHSIPPGSAVWLLWVSNVFLEGIPTFHRFDREVRRIRAKRQKAATGH